MIRAHFSLKLLASRLIVAIVMLMGLTLPCGTAWASTENTVVVSLGDSYSSGEGCPPFYGQDSENKYDNEDWLAHRSTHSWEGQLVVNGVKLRDVKCSQQDSNIDSTTRWYFYASSGAVAVNVYSTTKEDGKYVDAQKKPVEVGVMNARSPLLADRANFTTIDKYVQVQIVEAIEDLEKDNLKADDVDYVTLSIGGNDIGFADIVTKVALHSGFIDRDYLDNAMYEAWTTFQNDKRESIKNCYTRIAEEFPNAQVVIAGYPTLMDDDDFEMLLGNNQTGLWGQATITWEQFKTLFRDNASHAVGFSSWEGWFVNQNAHRLNSELSILVSETNSELMAKNESADAARLHFVHVESLFDGHEKQFLNGVKLLQSEDLKRVPPVSSYSMHPNYIKDMESVEDDPMDGVGCYWKAVQQEINRLEVESERASQDGASNATVQSNVETARDIVLALDVSGSMEGDPLQATKDAAKGFMGILEPYETRCGLVTYSSDASTELSLTRDYNALIRAVDGLYADGQTNIGDALRSSAAAVTSGSSNTKSIIVLMSDGIANTGMEGEELVDYARSIKEQGVTIYTVGFFGELGTDRPEAQGLMEEIASQGCHYEIDTAADLDAFFTDIAEQINGKRYLYLRAACPVDIEVTHNGETLRSTEGSTRDRASFGTITYEEIDGSDDRVKVLRVEEGPTYDVKFFGYADGYMKCTFGLVDDEGDYTDMRVFDVDVNNRMSAKMTLERADSTTMQVDEDGDGQYELVLKAASNGVAKEVDNSESARRALVACGLTTLAVGCAGTALSIIARRLRS